MSVTGKTEHHSLKLADSVNSRDLKNTQTNGMYGTVMKYQMSLQHKYILWVHTIT